LVRLWALSSALILMSDTWLIAPIQPRPCKEYQNLRFRKKWEITANPPSDKSKKVLNDLPNSIEFKLADAGNVCSHRGLILDLDKINLHLLLSSFFFFSFSGSLGGRQPNNFADESTSFDSMVHEKYFKACPSVNVCGNKNCW
jgi:hypothetical protein